MDSENIKIYRDDFEDRVSIVVKNRQKRPITDLNDICPFCPGGVEFQNSTGCYFFKNRFPAMEKDNCEVVVYSQSHHSRFSDLSESEIAEIVELWKNRTAYFSQKKDVKYVLIFENSGAEVGATISHPHGQIYAFDFIPKIPLHEIKQDLCVMCNDIDDKLKLLETDSFVAYIIMAASYPFELTIRSKSHVSSLTNLNEAETIDLAYVLKTVITALSNVFSSPMPYMLWIHQGILDDAYVDKTHLHIHICGLYRSNNTLRYIAAGELGSGVMFNPIDPYDACLMLNEQITANNSNRK